MINPLFKELALENRATQNRRNKNSEIVIYAEIGDVDGFKQAYRKEYHLQLESSVTNKKGRMRARYTKLGTKQRYELTMKRSESIEPDTPGIVKVAIENTVRTDEDFFQGFRHLADHALLKTRYVFHSKEIELKVKHKGNPDPKHYIIPNVEYEVDVFMDKEGKMSPICKIDVEVDVIYNYLTNNHPELKDARLSLMIKVSHLPFKPKNVEMVLIDADKEKYDAFWQSVRLDALTTDIESLKELEREDKERDLVQDDEGEEGGVDDESSE